LCVFRPTEAVESICDPLPSLRFLGEMIYAKGRCQRWTSAVIRLKRIYNFLCSMLVYAPFALCLFTLRGVFMRFPELTY
jgi:hypothetical protein